LGTLVNNSDARGILQALLELPKENYPRKQISDRDRNPDRGSCNEVPGGWEFVGDYCVDWDYNSWDVGSFAFHKKSDYGHSSSVIDSTF
jgi:hypothetical protein